MHDTHYKFVIEMLTEDGGTSLGQFPVQADWEPAREFLRLLALRRCTGENPAQIGNAEIEPVWAEKEGEPNVVGARLTDGDLVCQMTLTYFKPLAVEISGELVEKKLLKSGEHFLFRLFAYRQPPEEKNGSRIAFTMKDATPPLRFVDSSLAEMRDAAAPHGECDAGEIPVFIPQRVLDEAEQITREAGSNETGGILIGHLHRDASVPEIAVVITAQIPARHTESKTTSLTFTAETWTAVQAALDLRRSGEMMLGWWHSHPSFAFCNAECPAERRRECALQKSFLSSDDLLLHRTVFPKAYHIALLANNPDAGLEFALFGWSGGTVQRRGFGIPGAAPVAAESEPEFSQQTSNKDHDHVTPCKQ